MSIFLSKFYLILVLLQIVILFVILFKSKYYETVLLFLIAFEHADFD